MGRWRHSACRQHGVGRQIIAALLALKRLAESSRPPPPPNRITFLNVPLLLFLFGDGPDSA
ncbi:MAG: hypothetical protein H6667_12525 [Ardenticatenaceae bacterium]|nr:hypothetical protein [Ardenticatenaceae bacterium]